MVTWLRNYQLFYFGIFNQFDVMSDKHPELSTKLCTSGKVFQDLVDAKNG